MTAWDIYDQVNGPLPQFAGVVVPGGAMSAPPGYAMCGRTGPIIERGDARTLCGNLPLGGQGIRDEYPPLVADDGYRFYDNPYSTSWGGRYAQLVGNMWRTDPAAPIALPQSTPGRVIAAPRPMEAPAQPARMRDRPLVSQAPDWQLGPTRKNDTRNRPTLDDPSTWDGPQTYAPNKPVAPGVPKPDSPYAPPKPGVKEKKAKAPGWVAKLAAKAWDLTEAADLAENLFDCLPDDIKDTVKKSGVTSKTAFVGKGKRYATAIDMAQHVHKHMKSIDMDCATTKLACNQLEDFVAGTFFATADKGLYRGGVAGGTTAMRPAGGGVMMAPSELKKFQKWLKNNHPDIAEQAKSLQCEKWGLWKSLQKLDLK